MKKILSIIALGLTMVSCVDTVILPDDKIVDEDFWQTKADVQGIVACAYQQLKTEALQMNMIVWGDYRSDELMFNEDNASSDLTNTTAYVQDLQQVYSLNILPSNSFTNWGALYSAINYCNLVMEKAQGVLSLDPNYTEGDYKTDISKVKALRALCYFYLVRVFRDVPVSTQAYTTDAQERLLEQQAPAAVLDLCIQDLKDAEADAILSNTYGDWRDKGYLTRDAVCALLADIYLWRASVNHKGNPAQALADYQASIEYCDKVIASKKVAHILDPRGEVEQDYYLADYQDYYDDVFGRNTGGRGFRSILGSNSEESIFEIQYRSYSNVTNMIRYGANSGIVRMLYSYNNNNNKKNIPYLKTTTVYGKVGAAARDNNIFKNNEDVRLSEFVYGANSGIDRFGVRKYIAAGSCERSVESAGGANVGEVYSNWILYRLSDIMLMKAEALVQVKQLVEGDADNGSSAYITEAFELVKAVNARSLPDGEASASVLKINQYRDNMESLVLQERARELCFEGKRWFDLMRYNYRHMDGVQYDKTFAQMDGNYPANYTEMLTLAMTVKYTSPQAMASKMPTEPYLYWPINTSQIDVNEKLIQNPVWRASASSERN